MTVARDTHRLRSGRLVLRYAGLQAAAAVLAALLALALGGLAAAAAALAGGLIATVGNVVFGWRVFAPGVAPVRTMTRALYAGELLKWLWIGGALWAALGPARLAPLPLMAGLIAAQVGFWIGVAVIR